MSRDWDDEQPSTVIVNLVYGPANKHEHFEAGAQVGAVPKSCLETQNHKLIFFATEHDGGHMSGFLGEKEVLTRDRVKEIFRKKEYSYIEEKVNLLEVRDDSLLLKISFLLEYKNRMISLEENEPIVVPYKDFRVEDWGDGVRKIADIE